MPHTFSLFEVSQEQGRSGSFKMRLSFVSDVDIPSHVSSEIIAGWNEIQRQIAEGEVYADKLPTEPGWVTYVKTTDLQLTLARVREIMARRKIAESP